MPHVKRKRLFLVGGALLAGGLMPILLNLTANTAALARRRATPEQRQATLQRTGGLYSRFVLLPGLAFLGAITGYSSENARTLANRVLAGAAGGLLGAQGLDNVRWWGYHRGFTGKGNPETQAGGFGHMILGPKADDAHAHALGYTYHMLNGMGFGITYSLMAGPVGWAWAVVWGAIIWFMNMITPPTLMQGAGPFLHRRGWRPASISLAGHLAYGAILGLAVHTWARPKGSVFDLLSEQMD